MFAFLAGLERERDADTSKGCNTQLLVRISGDTRAVTGLRGDPFFFLHPCLPATELGIWRQTSQRYSAFRRGKLKSRLVMPSVLIVANYRDTDNDDGSARQLAFEVANCRDTDKADGSALQLAFETRDAVQWSPQYN